MTSISVETHVVRWSIEPRGAARGRTERVSVLLRLCDENGGLGYGEAAPLPGMSPDGIDEVIEAFAPAADMESWTTLPSARFAVETAITSAEAHAKGIPMSALLAATPARSVDTVPVVDTADEARTAWALGVRRFKIKIGPDEMPKLAAMAAALPEAWFRVDANRSWPDADVHALLDEARKFQVDFVEEPSANSRALLHDDRVRTPIALDESLVGITNNELAAIHESPRLAALVLKPTLHGLFRSVELARRSKFPIISHALEGPIGFAACCEVGLACGSGRSMGLAPHPGLMTWAVRPRQISLFEVRPAGPGLGFERAWRVEEFRDARDPRRGPTTTLVTRRAARIVDIGAPE